MILKGIDISKWQGTIDFSKVAKDSQNKKFVIIKATQGITITDGKLIYNSTEANKNKLLVSYYHYANTSINAKLQANKFDVHNIVPNYEDIYKRTLQKQSKKDL